MATRNKGFEEWLKTQPSCVQQLAKEFPIGMQIDVSGTNHFLVGYTEDDKVIVSPIDPFDDYDEAVEKRQWLCADHLRSKRCS